jgi:DNA polymerase/3'-5' exonuclease PolX
MSEGKRMIFYDALDLANSFIADVGGGCEHIEIAGSLRRLKPDVGDIEIVCIPKVVMGLDLFGGPGEQKNVLDDYLSGYQIVKGGEHYKKIRLASIDIDLFITTPEKWGVIFMIRTGSAEFSHRMVTPRNQGGLMPSNYHVKDGRVWHKADTSPIDTPNEIDVFRLWGMAYIEPKDRTK